MEEWQERLRSARKDAGLTMLELATRSGISEASLRSYETGRRHPSHQHLVRLLDALHLDRRARNLIAASAGFASEEPRYEYRQQRRTQREAAALVRQRPWPAFLINEHFTILAVNDMGLRLAGTTRKSLRGADLSLLSLATSEGAEGRLLNWEESLRRTISRIKASGARTLKEPNANLAGVLQRITGGDPQLIQRLADLWKSTPADPTRHTSWAYDAAWSIPSGRAIEFRCIAHCVSARDALDIHDWIPANAESHRLLDELGKGRPRSRLRR